MENAEVNVNVYLQGELLVQFITKQAIPRKGDRYALDVGGKSYLMNVYAVTVRQVVDLDDRNNYVSKTSFDIRCTAIPKIDSIEV